MRCVGPGCRPGCGRAAGCVGSPRGAPRGPPRWRPRPRGLEGLGGPGPVGGAGDVPGHHGVQVVRVQVPPDGAGPPRPRTLPQYQTITRLSARSRSARGRTRTRSSCAGGRAGSRPPGARSRSRRPGGPAGRACRSCHQAAAAPRRPGAAPDLLAALHRGISRPAATSRVSRTEHRSSAAAEQVRRLEGILPQAAGPPGRRRDVGFQ